MLDVELCAFGDAVVDCTVDPAVVDEAVELPDAALDEALPSVDWMKRLEIAQMS